jgi:hypothetical protein
MSSTCTRTTTKATRFGGMEVRIQLGETPALLSSTLPARQPGCPGWHTALPVEGAAALPHPAETSFGALAKAASSAHGCRPAEVVIASPRQLAVGVFCACGHRAEGALGQVGRLRCPSCGALAPSALSVAHTVVPAAADPDCPLGVAGFPATDIVWSTVSVKPRADWLPWVFGPPVAGPPGRPRIGLVGLGAIGYPASEVLARRGYALDLVDFDVVEERNLSGSYGVPAVGQPKALASRDRLAWLLANADLRAWHGDIIRDIGLGIMAQWDAAVLCLDRASSKVAASEYLELLGVPYVQAQIDGASRSALVRTYVPGETCCLQCLLEPDEVELDAVFGCRPEPHRKVGGAPALFTSPVEAYVAAGLIADQLSQLVAPPRVGSLPPAPSGGPG